MDTHDIIIELANEGIVGAFSFKTFKSYGLFQERIDMNPEIERVFKLALDKRESYHMPFWDSFNLSLFDTEQHNFDFMNVVIFHNSPIENIKVNSFEISEFLKTIENEYDYLTINSNVIDVNSVSKQLVLLDFHIPVNQNNQRICAEVIKTLGLKGYLLDSGKSFHFFGEKLVSEEALQNILHRCLLFCPIIDRAWITHQLIEKSCCLRVSKKYDRIPFVVEKI